MSKPNCKWGQIQSAYVPAVTFCTLTFETAYNYDLGYYKDGFWIESNQKSLPFLKQSFKGQYTSPLLNGAKAEDFGR